MELNQKNKKMIFAIVIVLCLFFIFFVGRTFNAKSGGRHLSFTGNGIQHFRKGLDVSGGTKLVYKISYDKYEQVYEGAELESIKKTIEKIILKNIDNRVSALGVSDYKAYVENMDGNPYIVVEIGGIADLDQAKEIIGKTVELEFRLPNKAEPTEQDRLDRQNMAYNLRSEILAASGNMEKLAATRGSDNIFYEYWTGISAGDMPEIIKNNPKLLQSNIGEISDVVGGLYHTLSYRDLSGNIQSQDLLGYTFVRINDRKTVSIDSVTVNDVLNITQQLGNEYKEHIVRESTQSEGKYGFVDGNLVYNLGAIGKGLELFDVKIVQVATQTAELGASEDKIQEINSTNEKKIQSVIDMMKESDEFASLDAVLLANDWAESDKIQEIIPDFDSTKIGQVETYKSINNTYVVYLRDKKDKGQDIFSELIVYDIDQDSFNEAIKSKVVYDIETVFVQDRETWLTAKTSKGDILNGAYFKYANVSQGQMGEPVVAINFDEKGKEVFCDITTENVGEQMAIFVGGVKLSDPVINEKICGGTAQIDGGFTSESAKQLVDNLNNGALPASLILMQEDKVSPTLGDSALQGALIAALVGILAIFVYIWILYGFKKGLISLLVLLSFVIILAGFMKLVDYALSLSGIAAVILSIGMAVDSNILIYERTKEEESVGKSVESAIDTAYDRSRPAIRDGNLSTGLIALLLFFLGTNMFKGFGTMLMVTILLTLFVNVPLTKVLLKMFYKNNK